MRFMVFFDKFDSDPSLHYSTPETPTRHQNARNGAGFVGVFASRSYQQIPAYTTLFVVPFVGVKRGVVPKWR